MHRLQLDSAREEPKELGTPLVYFGKLAISGVAQGAHIPFG